MGVFDNVGALLPGRSVFDLSYEKKLTCDMGQLIPVMCDEMVPGDIFQVGNEILLRFQPLITPIMHEVNIFVHYFFVPYRILWDEWEEFITGGADGHNLSVLPRWTPVSTALGGLWDYLGFPVGVSPTDAMPLAFPRNAYNRIYNEYYRDETLQVEVSENNETILNRAWEKDYFTSSLPWQQRGTAPSFPISGTAHAVWNASTFPASAGDTTLQAKGGAGYPFIYNAAAAANPAANILAAFNANSVDLSSAITFDVAQVRLAFQTQKWMERNARCGARYTEYLRGHYGVAPRDDRLQRPEYVGGSRQPVIVSEVLQTSSTDAETPQGNMAGHGLSVARNFCGKYRALEFGLMMGVMSVMPRSAYQQGIDRQWLRRSRLDFYTPEFANLSEQAVERAEIYASNVAVENRTIFGYQGRFDEMRVKRNMVVNLMREDSFNTWHLGRIFSNPPILNESFIKCVPTKRIFAVQSEPGLLVNVGNIIKAVRPLPYASNPGLIDHN